MYHTTNVISYYNYNMYNTVITLVYKYLEARLRLQLLSPLDLSGLGGRQGGTFIQTYHTTIIICTTQQPYLFVYKYQELD